MQQTKHYEIVYFTHNSERRIGCVNDAPDHEAALAAFCDANGITRAKDGIKGRSGQLSAYVQVMQSYPVTPGPVIDKVYNRGCDKRQIMLAKQSGFTLKIESLPAGDGKLFPHPIIDFQPAPSQPISETISETISERKSEAKSPQESSPRSFVYRVVWIDRNGGIDWTKRPHKSLREAAIAAATVSDFSMVYRVRIAKQYDGETIVKAHGRTFSGSYVNGFYQPANR